jgi:regulator of replication initiation timing
MTTTELPTFRSIPVAQQPSDHAAVKRELRRALLENRRLARENEELRQQLDRRQL